MNKDSSYIGRLFLGTVVANSGTEPTLHQGEVKVYVPELYTNDLSILPVALYFRNDLGGAQSFGVLSIGRRVILELQDGDPQCPIVRCSVLTPSLLPSEFVAGYPNVYGWADETGNVFLVNKATGLTKFTNAAGASFQILGSALNVTIPGAATIHSTGNLNLISDAKVSITAPMIEEN